MRAGLLLVLWIVLRGCGGRSAARLPGADAGADGGANDVANEGASDAAAAPGEPDAASVRDTRDAYQPRTDAGFAGALEGFCEEKARAWCAVLARCNRAYAPEEECRAVEKAGCFGPVGAWQARAASEGRVELAPSSMTACLEAIAGLTCGLVGEPPAACAAVVAGTVGDGQACVRADECRGGFCELPDDTCPGKCRALSAVGGPCATNADCEAGRGYCQVTSLVLLCGVADASCRCAARRGPGQACKYLDECLPGLLCEAGACRAPGAAKGDACGFETGCAGDLACLGRPPLPDDTTLGVCGDRLPEGAPCLGDECRAGLHCEFRTTGGGVCRRDAELGESCEPFESFQAPCPLGAFCDDSHVCRARPKVGESCAGAARSACWGAHLGCFAIGGIGPLCLQIPSVNQSCETTCVEGAVCQASVCVPKRVAGAPCADGSQCASGRCTVARKVCILACTEESVRDGGT